MLISKAKKIIMANNQVIKFLIIGVSSVIADLLLLTLLVSILRFNTVLSVAITQILVLIYNFYLNKYWAFQSDKHNIKEVVRYILLVCINYSMGLIIMYIFNTIFSFNYQLVRIINVALMSIINFFAYKYWVYSVK